MCFKGAIVTLLFKKEGRDRLGVCVSIQGLHSTKGSFVLKLREGHSKCAPILANFEGCIASPAIRVHLLQDTSADRWSHSITERRLGMMGITAPTAPTTLTGCLYCLKPHESTRGQPPHPRSLVLVQQHC